MVTIKEKTGRKEETIQLPPEATLQDVVNWLNKKYRLQLPHPSIMAILNGRGWGQLQESLNTVIKDGDTICLFPPISGG